jgi:putative GTP pyrophosphokinase
MHYVCTLKTTSQGAHYQGLHGIRFEIQARTILMDAWANVSHHLAYKGANSIPAEKKRAFHALAGLFFVADNQFEQFLTSNSAIDPVSASTPSTAVGISRDTVDEMLAAIFPERTSYYDELARLNAVSEFVEEVTAAGFKTLDNLHETLLKWMPNAKRYEFAYPPAAAPDEENDGLYFAVGLARVALLIGDDSFREQYSRDVPRKTLKKYLDYR